MSETSNTSPAAPLEAKVAGMAQLVQSFPLRIATGRFVRALTDIQTLLSFADTEVAEGVVAGLLAASREEIAGFDTEVDAFTKKKFVVVVPGVAIERALAALRPGSTSASAS